MTADLTVLFPVVYLLYNKQGRRRNDLLMTCHRSKSEVPFRKGLPDSSAKVNAQHGTCLCSDHLTRQKAPVAVFSPKDKSLEALSPRQGRVVCCLFTKSSNIHECLRGSR